MALHYDSRWIIMDAGTGIRSLGEKLRGTRDQIFILFSHFHWDHVVGLPFFAPLFKKNRVIQLWGPEKYMIKKVLGRMIAPPYFPVRLSHFPAKISFRKIREGVFSFGKIRVEARKVGHTDYALGFQFHMPVGKRFIHVADGRLEPTDKKFLSWIQDADFLIHDAHFSNREYKKMKGWGHSSYENVLAAAHQARVKNLILFHHPPQASDLELERRLKRCRKWLKKKASQMKVKLAKEGTSIRL